jgi:hypothetical protein
MNLVNYFQSFFLFFEIPKEDGFVVSLFLVFCVFLGGFLRLFLGILCVFTTFIDLLAEKDS